MDQPDGLERCIYTSTVNEHGEFPVRLTQDMVVIAPPQDADQVRPASAINAFASAAPGVAPLMPRAINKPEPSAREFSQAFDLAARQLAQSLNATEAAAQALLEQLLLLRWLDLRGWLGGGNNVLCEQFQLHWEADPDSHSFYTNFVLPRVRVLAAAGLLSQTTTPPATLPLANATCLPIFDGLFLPYRFALEASDKEAEKLVTPAVMGALLARAAAETSGKTAMAAQRRMTVSFVPPRRVARWMCRAALTQYLQNILSEATQLAASELRARLDGFFALPPAAQLTEAQEAELHGFFLRAEAQRMSRALLSCRVCDPAAGSGELLAAMLEELAAALAKLDVQLYGRAIVQQHNYEFRLKRNLINECLFAVDSHETAVRLTRQRLWLALVAVEQSQPDTALTVTMREAVTTAGLTANLFVGDALLGCRAFEDEADAAAFKWRKAFPKIFNTRGGFDILLGHPPFRPAQDKKHWAQLCALFPQLKRAKHLAAAYFDLPRFIGAPHALACQVIPRALTLAEGWAATRAGLRLNYDLLIAADAGELFNDARFDQEVLLYRRENSFNETSVEPLAALSETASDTPLMEESSAAPALALAHVSPVGRDLLERFARWPALNEIATIKHGQRWQRRRAKANDSASVTVPVIKAAHLRQFRLTDELPRQEPPAYIQRVLEEMRQPKLVIAQTLAHLKKPYDTLVLMSALDRQGAVALEAVNQIFPHADCPFSLELLCAVLNSSWARWYFHFAVFQRPGQAVECTAAELGRLPLPKRPAASLVTQAERLARKLLKTELPRKYFLRGQNADYDALDELVCELYGLSEEERAEVWRQH
jgi:hypothetical protein